MRKELLKGFSRSVSFHFFQKQLLELLTEYSRSMRFNLELPDYQDKFNNSTLEGLVKFKKYFLRRINIINSQNIIKFKVNIRNSKDIRQSIEQVSEEILASQEQIDIWKNKVKDGRYGESELVESDKRMYYLFKYEVYFSYLKTKNKVLSNLLDFLSVNYRNELVEINKSKNREFIRIENNSKETQFVRNTEELLTIQDVCKLLNKSRSTIHRYCKNGSLKKSVIGGSVYFLKADILKIIEKNKA